MSCMMLKQTKCCNSHLCINHKDWDGGRGSANIWEILQVFLPTYLLQNCTINKHRMRNINLIFFCDISTHWIATFVWKNLLISLVNETGKKLHVCPTNYFVFFSFSRDSWHHSSSSNFIRHQACYWSTDFWDWNTLQKKICQGVNSIIRAFINF